MKHLIIYAHPNNASLNSRFRELAAQTLIANGNEVVVRDLNQLNFNPVLSLDDMNGQRKGEVTDEIRIEQDFIRWADDLTFVYPIWWTGMPAIMKGYIDRVFTYGFAYRYDKGIQKGLLTGKSVYIINTQGKSHEEYASIGMDKALQLTSDHGIFRYCGFTIKRHFFFDKADRAGSEQVLNWSAELHNELSQNQKIAI